MTLEPLTKEEMEYVTSHDKTANVVVTNRQHPHKKTRFLEITTDSLKYLRECRQIQESKIIEKHGYFEEEYTDKNGQKRTHQVFYK